MKHITQHELLEDFPAIMRAIENGAGFVITRDGIPIVDIIPLGRTEVVVDRNTSNNSIFGS
ncbi:hypothetical protein GCM10023321_18330 [Pseudonocardia eucalypti]|uniref:Prevent-host-death family protein n=1 Tax=Pseudonocardia eucalypti TaxID=648755 RepID=A0ABP9PTX7_9PSEU|nr:antitoxin (DNA-binding transcriptional repressor) of toxin-antitoxin stability system [Pseudonocardia eucalypti]